MYTSILPLDSVLQSLFPAFTQPSPETHVQVLLGWVMCLSKRTEYGVFETISAGIPVSRKKRHPFDRFYNFFSRSAWTVQGLAREVAVSIVVRLNRRGVLHLVVDDTLLHKRGKHVYGLGWFRHGRGLDGKTYGHRQRQPLGRDRTGDPDSWNQQNLSSADPRDAALARQESKPPWPS